MYAKKKNTRSRGFQDRLYLLKDRLKKKKKRLKRKDRLKRKASHSFFSFEVWLLSVLYCFTLFTGEWYFNYVVMNTPRVCLVEKTLIH